MTRKSMLSSLKGSSLKARTVRGSALVVVGFGGALVLRLAGNLALTRILFPEAFGLMALVQIFLFGLQLLSDLGVYPSILQSPRGNDAKFLNTAWVIEIVRGVLLWLITCMVAAPIAAFYEQPMLAQLLPVAGLIAVINGFKSTRLAQANRNLNFERLTVLDIGSQVIGVAMTVILAIITQSVWALLLGSLIGEFVRSAASHVLLPGVRNRFAWDRSSAYQLFQFGKFIFISSIAGFAISSADRAILGKAVSIAELGIYNIGYFLAFVPMLMTHRLSDKILMPLYSIEHRDDGEEGHKLTTARSALAGSMIVGAFILGCIGDWLVRFLYTEPYYLAGPVLVLLSLSIMPVIVMSHYKVCFLGAGRSARSAIFLVGTAILQLIVLYLVVPEYGLLGAIIAPGLASILAYPLVVALARPIGAWTPGHDLAGFLFTLISAAIVLALNPDAVARLLS